MIQKTDGEAVISLERYKQLLEYEQLLKSNESYVLIWTGDLIYKNLTIGKLETQEILAKELHDLSQTINNLYSEIDDIKRNKKSLLREKDESDAELKAIKAKWWYKFFTFFYTEPISYIR